MATTSRLKRILKKRWRFLVNSFSKITGAKQAVADKKGKAVENPEGLPGKTRPEQLGEIERFLDEGDYLMKKTNSIIILQNVFCEGAKDFGAYDRTCFYFCLEECLEKIVQDF